MDLRVCAVALLFACASPPQKPVKTPVAPVVPPAPLRPPIRWSAIPDAEPETPRVARKFKAGSVTKMMSDHEAEFVECYEQSLDRGAARDVYLEIKARVWPSGRVTDVEISPSDVERTALGACISDVAGTWRMPAFDEEARHVTVPLHLSARTS